jgi:hypothetical protein
MIIKNMKHIKLFEELFSSKPKEKYTCETCGKELTDKTPVFVIDNKLFHNNSDCIFEYTKKTGRKVTGRSPMNLKDAIKKIKNNKK